MTSTYRVLGLLGVTCFLLSAFTPLPNLLYHRLAVPSRIQPAGAIVVLGAGVSRDGILGSESLRRALQGILLQRKGLAPLIVLLGPAPFRGSLAEAEVRAELARELGVPPEATLTESQVETTRAEAVRVRLLLQPRGIRRILLVTDSQHMVRARALFERAGFEVFPAPVDDISDAANSPEGRLDLTRRVLQEVLARVYYRVSGYL